MRFRWLIMLAVAGAMSTGSTARAGEIGIGEPVRRHGMEIAAVYLQPVTMEPHLGHHGADIHLEADIRALAANPHGFREGDWIPHLDVSYEIAKAGSAWKAAGALVPMVASDGPHYGDNIKLDGPGRYRLTLTFAPGSHSFRRHTDKETGIPAWWPPFALDWDFAYAGVGKKGGY